MFLAFKKFRNLNLNNSDKVLLLEILKLKFSVASVDQMKLYTDIHKWCSKLNPCIFLFSSVC